MRSFSTQNQTRSYSLESKHRKRRRSDRSGAILVLFAILIPLLLVIAGFGFYIANAQMLRTELRTATDFAARAGAKQLSLQQNEGAAIAAAIDAASRNTILGQPLTLSASQVEIGTTRQIGGQNGRFEFTSGGAEKNSVRVSGRSLGNQGLTGFFASLADLQETEFNIGATAANSDRDICLVIDRSGSMTQPVSSTANGTKEACGPLPADTRFAALARAVDTFINELNATPQREQICLASYSSNVVVACRCCPTESNPCAGIRSDCNGNVAYILRFTESEIHSNLSFNSSSLTVPIRSMLIRGIAGATAIGSGLTSGIQAVEGPGARPFAFPTIVLLTDGNQNEGIDPVIVARQAAAKEIVVHTVTFGAGADQALMREVANITGGKHIHADNEQALKEAFKEIANTLPVMLTN